MRAFESGRERKPGAARKAAPVPDRGLAAALVLQRRIGNRNLSSALEAEFHGFDDVHGHDDSHGQADPAVQRSAVEKVLSSSSWQPLETGLRSRLEPEVGMSLAHVRMFRGAAARQSAALLDAAAYASGPNIVIGEGGDNEKTIRHEARHVKQQSIGPVPGTDNGAGLWVSDPHDPCEQEAAAE